jgi:hypothetical protein
VTTSASADFFFVYIVGCADASLYVGDTTDVAARVSFVTTPASVPNGLPQRRR